jgi:hypothetical protein
MQFSTLNRTPSPPYCETYPVSWGVTPCSFVDEYQSTRHHISRVRNHPIHLREALKSPQCSPAGCVAQRCGHMFSGRSGHVDKLLRTRGQAGQDTCTGRSGHMCTGWSGYVDRLLRTRAQADKDTWTGWSAYVHTPVRTRGQAGQDTCAQAGQDRYAQIGKDTWTGWSGHMCTGRSGHVDTLIRTDVHRSVRARGQAGQDTCAPAGQDTWTGCSEHKLSLTLNVDSTYE